MKTLEEKVDSVKQKGLRAYNFLDEETRKDEQVIKALLEYSKNHANKLIIDSFSAIKKTEAKYIFYCLDNGLSTEIENYMDIEKFYSSLSSDDKKTVEDFCLEFAENPDRYFAFSTDLKFADAISDYVIRVVSDYENFFQNYNYEKHDSFELGGVKTRIKLYDSFFEDIRNEIQWAKEEYRARNRMLKREAMLYASKRL